MKEILDWLNHFYGQLPSRLLARPWRSWAVILLLSALCGLGVVRLQFDMSMDAFLVEGDPQKEAYERFKENFQGDENILLVFRAKDGDLFSEASLQALIDLHQALEDQSLADAPPGQINWLSHLVTLRSLVNASYLEVEGDLLSSRDFVGTSLPEGQEARAKLKQQALAHPDFVGMYLSKDAQYGVITLETDFGTQMLAEEDQTPSNAFEIKTEAQLANQKKPKFKPTGMEEYSAFMDQMRQITQQPRFAERFEFHSIGMPSVMDYFFRVVLGQLGILYIFSFGLMFVLVWVLFRSFSATLWLLLIVALSSLLCLGVAGWMGLVMSSLISVLVLLQLVVGLADGVHVLSGFFQFRQEGKGFEEALGLAYRKSGLACMLTSLTTAVGLLSLLLVPIKPIRNFGVTASLGVLAAYLLTIFMLPLLLGAGLSWEGKMARNADGQAFEAGYMGYKAHFYLGTGNLSQLEKGKVALPWEVQLSSSRSLAGLNMPMINQTDLSLRLYF